ncbi:sigma 54-interacting transcriptional regulator [Brassicibacter mesophilus]|uniref:sigma 54-interacting transcriptional regulator n=1 Tax=Brassicibacter mesophilus TaxID=745119 RepID=UPI003D1BE968
MDSSLLSEIKEDVMKYAEVISNAIKVDVEIVDIDMRRIAGTGIFKDRIDIVNKGSVYKTVIETGQSQVIVNPREHEICKDCIEKDTCIEKMEISTPLIYEEDIIGVIGLVCSTNEQKKRIMEDLDSQMQFLYQISDFICSKIYQRQETKMQAQRTDMLKKILNNIDKGVIVLDAENKITIINNSAMRELVLSPFYINKQVEIINKNEYIMGGELHEVKIDNKSFFLVGNMIPIHSISKEYVKVFIFNNMDKINSDIYKITTSERKIRLDTIIGESIPMRQLKEKIRKIAFTKSTVLISGESGTGKELVARAIHAESDIRHKPFVAVNCGAIPETLIESELFGYVKGAFTGANPNGKIGKFELANGGIIFLDEIGDMPLYLQVKLLRVLQERTLTRVGSNQSIKLDIRVIAATNFNLKEKVKEKKFREDLYYRLNVIPVELPPLREREGDVLLIMTKLVEKYGRLFNKYIHTIENDVKEAISNYSWPGNVRELQNTIEFMINLCGDKGILRKNMLPDAVLNNRTVYNEEHRKEHNEETLKTLQELEHEYIQKALDIYGTSTEGKKLAAEKLGIGVATLYRKMKT